MIDKLRRKMIWVSGTALVVVFLTIFVAIYIIGTQQLNTAMDMLCDRISDGGGMFSPFDKEHPRPSEMDRFPGFFTAETPFSTRFFVVRFDTNGDIIDANTESVSSVTQEDAYEYAYAVQKKGNLRGWKDSYRYKIFDTPDGQSAVFVDGSMNRATTRTLLITSGCVLAGSLAVILLLITMLSRRAVRPMAESYEKQKQFVTDANHELKTPLTLILTNLDILETETGKNEWLDDIRSEGQRMSALVSQLTALSRLDEDRPHMQFVCFPLSEMLEDTIAEFTPLVNKRGLTMNRSIQPGLQYTGDEGALRRAVAILLDNAVKYCDTGGYISLSLYTKHHLIITVENTCREVDSIELNRLFDRFYREDKARTSSGSFGIGLSLAQAIIDRHHGEVSAYKAGEGQIGFKIILK